MIGLILKDILIQKKTIMISLIYCVLFSVVFGKASGVESAFIAGTFAVSYLFIVYVCSYEERYNGLAIFSSLPVKRDEIVISKYISVFLFAFIGFMLTLLTHLILNKIGIVNTVPKLSFELIVGLVFSVCIIGALYYPVYFRFGYMKSKFIMFGVFMAIGFLPTMAVRLVDKDYFMDRLKILSDGINNLPDVLIGGIILLSGALITIISMLYSIKVFRGKDL